MKSQLKGFVLGFLSAIILILLSISIYAVSSQKTISVVVNKVSIKINGNAFKQNTFNWNGVTYVPLQTAFAAADCRVSVDSKNNAVTVDNNSKISIYPVLGINKVQLPKDKIINYTQNGHVLYYVDALYLLDRLNIKYEYYSKDKDDLGFFNITLHSSSSYTTSTTAVDRAFPLQLYSNDGKVYLGKCVTDTLDRDSIFDTYGNYGSEYSKTSIFNEYGDYGSKFSDKSAFNNLATHPPKILDNNGNLFGYLTTNTTISKGYTIEKLKQYLINNAQ